MVINNEPQRRLESNQWGLGKNLSGNSCKCPVHCRIDPIHNCCKTRTQFYLLCFHPGHTFYIALKLDRLEIETNRLGNLDTLYQMFQPHTFHTVWNPCLECTCLYRNVCMSPVPQSLCTCFFCTRCSHFVVLLIGMFLECNSNNLSFLLPVDNDRSHKLHRRLFELLHL